MDNGGNGANKEMKKLNFVQELAKKTEFLLFLELVLLVMAGMRGKKKKLLAGITS